MKKKIYAALVVLSFAVLSAGCSFSGKKDDPVSEEAVQSSTDIVQISVDETQLELLEKMKIVKDASVFDSAFLGKNCGLYQAYDMLNTMKGQDGAEVPYAYYGEQLTQKDLMSLYLKELFGIEVTDAEGSDFAFYTNKLGISEQFLDPAAEATNNDLIALTHACVLFGLDDWKNIKTVFQQMLESGYFNDTDITTFEVAAMDDIFNYGTLKCPATEIYDETTGRTYYFVTYFGNSYNSVTNKVKNLASIGMHGGGKEILQRPYFSMQNNLSDGTGFVFTRFPGNQAYLYDIETQTTTYIDTVRGNYGDGNFMYVSASDKLYYIKDVDEVRWVYRKDLKSDSEPEPIVQIEGGNLIHVTNDEKYLSVVATQYNTGNGTPFVRIDIENKKVEVVSHSIKNTKMPKGSSTVGHLTINPVYPELYFFAHIVDGTYLPNVTDRANIINIETGEIVTFNPGINPNKTSNNLPRVNIQINHESWSENGEYLYMTNMTADEANVSQGMIRMNKDGTHVRYITNLIMGLKQWQWRYAYPFMSSHGTASGDDRYVVTQGYYINLISQETNQIFPIALASDLEHTINIKATGSHPYHNHPTVSRGDSYLVNWGQYYVPYETREDIESGLLGVGYFDFTEIDENELAEGGEFAYNEYVSRLSYKVPKNLNYIDQLDYVYLDCESEEGTYFEKEAIHATAGNYAYFNVNTSIVDFSNETVTISFDYYDNDAQDMKLIYTKATVEDDIYSYAHSENGSVDIPCANTGEWKRAEIVVQGNFETSGKYGTDFKIGSASSDVYVTNIQVKKN